MSPDAVMLISIAHCLEVKWEILHVLGARVRKEKAGRAPSTQGR